MDVWMVDRDRVRHHKTGLCPCLPKLLAFTRRDIRTHCFCTPGYLYHHQSCSS